MFIDTENSVLWKSEAELFVDGTEEEDAADRDIDKDIEDAFIDITTIVETSEWDNWDLIEENYANEVDIIIPDIEELYMEPIAGIVPIEDGFMSLLEDVLEEEEPIVIMLTDGLTDYVVSGKDIEDVWDLDMPEEFVIEEDTDHATEDGWPESEDYARERDSVYGLIGMLEEFVEDIKDVIVTGVEDIEESEDAIIEDIEDAEELEDKDIDIAIIKDKENVDIDGFMLMLKNVLEEDIVDMLDLEDVHTNIDIIIIVDTQEPEENIVIIETSIMAKDSDNVDGLIIINADGLIDKDIEDASGETIYVDLSDKDI
mgnify:CR=1 FL=1